MPPLPIELPEEIARRVRDVNWIVVRAGRSRAQVYAFSNGLYLKTVERDAEDDVFGNLETERHSLHALSSLATVPKLEAFVRDERRDYLLMTELVGRDASALTQPHERLAAVKTLAAGCRRLHATEAPDFPFVASVEALLSQAERRLRLGLVDATDFDAERAGWSPQDVFDELCRLAPAETERVLTHGDLCLPNMILQGDDGLGFVDVGRASLSDRWRDLALCVRSVQSDWGTRCCDEFLRAYGAQRDDRKLRFYTVLDEFF